MPYEAVGIDGQEYVRFADGVEVERRPATGWERMALPRVPLDRSDEYATKLREQASAAIATILASRETLRAIVAKTNNQITGGDTKQVAREVMRSDKELLAVLRLISGALGSADTGAD